ncbi:MAG TPA: 2-phosphosulfolactate phosphatase [Parasegetibacter sp.]
MTQDKPSLYTCFSPALLHLYDVSDATVVIIDILRATSTITTILNNGAREVIPVDNVAKCIEIGKDLNAITAGERDGKIADGLSHGNSPFEYPRDFVQDKTVVLTTTNGTKLLHLALSNNAREIIIGSFLNLSAVCNFLRKTKRPVILGCAAWKDRVNMEDTLFAGAVVERLKDHYHINCDSSKIAASLYNSAKPDLFEFMKQNEASHYHRLMNFGLEKDIRYCLSEDQLNIVPFYHEGSLIIAQTAPTD